MCAYLKCENVTYQYVCKLTCNLGYLLLNASDGKIVQSSIPYIERPLLALIKLIIQHCYMHTC